MTPSRLKEIEQIAANLYEASPSDIANALNDLLAARIRPRRKIEAMHLGFKTNADATAKLAKHWKGKDSDKHAFHAGQAVAYENCATSLKRILELKGWE